MPGPRLVAALTVVAAVLCGAATAQANTTLLVNGTTGSDTSNNCQITPCRTIAHAIAQGELVPDTITISVAAGTYDTDLQLSALDTGLTIVGAGSGTSASTSTIITGDNSAATIGVGSTSPASLTLENLRVTNPAGARTRLAAGGYRLQAVGANAAGSGPAAYASFRVLTH